MATFRCPKHDVLFEANTAPNHNGHGKCPFCNPKLAPKPGEEPKEKPLAQGVD
jgi:hypothetical protein